MEAPAVLNRHRRPFLLPVWLTFAAAFGVLLLAAIAFFVYRATATTTLVVIARYADKDLTSIQDAPLSAEGEQQSQRLAQMFGRGTGHSHLDALYVIDARRAQQTAAPLVELLHASAIVVPAADTGALASRVMHEHDGGSVLVIGGSKTAVGLIHELGGIDIPPPADDDHDTMYVLSIPSFGRPSLLTLAY